MFLLCVVLLFVLCVVGAVVPTVSVFLVEHVNNRFVIVGVWRAHVFLPNHRHCQTIKVCFLSLPGTRLQIHSSRCYLDRVISETSSLHLQFCFSYCEIMGKARGAAKSVEDKLSDATESIKALEAELED